MNIDMNELPILFMQLFNAYRSAVDSGAFGSIADDFISGADKFSKARVEREVAAYKAYVEAGMSSQEAVQLILARRKVFRDDFNEFISRFGRTLNVELQRK